MMHAIQRSISYAVVAGVLFVAGAGCTTDHPNPCLAGEFTNYGHVVEHGEIFWLGRLRDPNDKRRVSQALYDYLSGKPGAPTFFPEPNAEAAAPKKSPAFVAHSRDLPPSDARCRDIAAICLSGLSGVPLHIFVWETDAQRDEKIREFLMRVQQRQ